MQYSPFGIPLRSEPYDAPTFGYTGREKSQSSYWYYRNRFYDARRGRFLSEDPIQQFTHVVGADRYSYVGNSPMNYTDPMGLKPCKWTIKPGGWFQTGWGMAQSYKFAADKVYQVPKVNPPGTRLGFGTRLGKKFPFNAKKWPMYVEFVHECAWQRKLTVTHYFKRKIRITLRCDCPNSETVWDDEETKSEDVTKITGGVVTKSSWLIGQPMKPCKPPS
jgi:RHS repeat-associated protein